MAVGDGAYLPPVVVTLLADDSDLMRKLADARAAIADFADQKPQATLNADDAPVMAKIAEAGAAGEAFARETFTARLDVDTGPALAKLAALQAAAGGLGGGGGGGGALAGAAAGAAAGGGGGGGKSTLGTLALAALLGHGGKGSGTGLLGALPAFGSIGALAGLGAEHLIMTGVGLAGSATGAALGGGLLALGSAGVGAVGMGTDLAGIGQAAGDIQAVAQAQSALAQAVAVYGAASTQAAQAQAQLNYTLNSFSPVAQAAVLQAANTASAFKQMFDAATGEAEKIGAEIITQAMQIGEKFLPTIGKYAAENMGIIQAQLQPFFSWLEGPGLDVFKQLEQMFTNELPAGVQVLTKAFEWLANTILTVEQDEAKWRQNAGTIPLLDQIDKFLSNPADVSKWSQDIGSLINLFHTWADFVKILAQDIYQIFHDDSHTATSIIQSLTTMLTKLHEWLTSTQGTAEVKNVFSAHKQEIDDLLKLIPPLVKAFGGLELTASPVLTRLLADFVNDALVPFLNIMASNKVTATLTALVLLEGRLKLLHTALALFNGASAAVGVISKLLGLGASAGGAEALGGGLAGTAGAVGAGVGVFAAWLALPAALQRMADQTKGILGNLENNIAMFVNPGVSLFTHLYDTLTHGEGIIQGFGTVWTDMKTVTTTAVDATEKAVDASWQGIQGAVSAGASWVESTASSAWNFIRSNSSSAWSGISSTVVNAVHSMGQGVASNIQGIENWFRGVYHDITSIFSGAGNWLYGVGRAIVQGLVNGISSIAGEVHSVVSSIVSDVKSIPVLGGLIGSPSPYFTNVGEAIMQGLALGITSGRGNALGALQSATTSIVNLGAQTVSHVQNTATTTHNYSTTVNAPTGQAHDIASTLAWQMRGYAASR